MTDDAVLDAQRRMWSAASAMDHTSLTPLTSVTAALAELGLRHLEPIIGGWQSVAVHRADLDGQPVVVKLLDPGAVEREAIATRLDALARLAATSDLVCAAVPVAGRLLNEIAVAPHGKLHAVAYQFAPGQPPEITRPDDAAQMGRVLAELHAAMADVPGHALFPLAAFPPLAALEQVAIDLDVSTAWLAEATPDGRDQLLHGDFSAANVRVDVSAPSATAEVGRGRWRVFDMDDCGRGPVELDIAHSLYFVLFDALTEPGHDHVYRQFRPSFVGGYQDRSGFVPADAVLDRLIARRVLTLASWIAAPGTAPVGIRTASAGWHRRLRAFVDRYLAMRC